MSRPGLRLTEEQRGRLSQEFQRTRGNKDLDMCLRIQALLLVSQGNREIDVADIIGAGRRTVQDWIHRYREGEIRALAKGPFQGGKSKLTEEQKADLPRVIEAGPQNAGLDTGVWTTPIIVKLVKDLFGVSYHPDHMGRLFHKLGYSVQYPGKRLSKADENLQMTWRLNELPQIKEKPGKMKA
jgi:putative transposase